MDTATPALDFPAAQGAIYRVALSVDALLVNGLQYGVLQPAVTDGFVQQVARSLLADVAALEGLVRQATDPGRGEGIRGIEALRRVTTALADEVAGLASFRQLPLAKVRSTVAHILSLRADCVRQIQALEAHLRTPKPFYVSRPSHSAAAVADFLADLERLFAEEWSASNPRKPAAPPRTAVPLFCPRCTAVLPPSTGDGLRRSCPLCGEQTGP